MEDEYREFLRGKRVVIVAPGQYLTGQKRGKEIDSYDVIVRINLDCPINPEYFRELYPDESKVASDISDVGSRTDVLYHTLFNEELAASARQDHSKRQAIAWRKDGVKFLVPRADKDGSRMARIHELMGEFIPPVVAIDRDWMNGLKRTLNTAPNMGNIAIWHLLTFPIASLTVMGMKFTVPWEGYRIGYGGFNAEQAVKGNGSGHWGQTNHPEIPHEQEPQIRLLQKTYFEDSRLSFDYEGALTLGVMRPPTVTALVPIKRHSERVTDKNLKTFCGKPLLYWTLAALQHAVHVGQIYVDTDSVEIQEIVGEFFPRIRVIRNEPMANANEIIANDLELLGEHVLQTHVTNPLLTSDTIDVAIQEYFDRLDEYDSLFSVTEHRVRLWSEQGIPINHVPTHLARSQDLRPVYEDNSNMYIFSAQSFKRAGNSRIGLTPQLFVMNKLEAVDIDYPEDFTLAEALMRVRLGENYFRSSVPVSPLQPVSQPAKGFWRVALYDSFAHYLCESCTFDSLKASDIVNHCLKSHGVIFSYKVDFVASNQASVQRFARVWEQIQPEFKGTFWVLGQELKIFAPTDAVITRKRSAYHMISQDTKAVGPRLTLLSRVGDTAYVQNRPMLVVDKTTQALSILRSFLIQVGGEIEEEEITTPNNSIDSVAEIDAEIGATA